MLIGVWSNTHWSLILKGENNIYLELISRFHNQKENLSDDPMNPLLQMNL